MSPDERALLAAVRATPADDTPRLVYADWLDEHGNPARAGFVRLQVEAERFHPDSNRGLMRAGFAASLFLSHWLDWWGEVCGAVGLPVPERPPQTRLGRLARRLTGGRPVGRPYRRAVYDPCDLEADAAPGRGAEAARRAGFERVGFGRGFADRLWVGPDSADLLARWPEGAPLHALRVELGLDPSGWRSGPHLAGVSRLTLRDPGWVLPLALSSPDLGGLAEFRLEATDWPGSLAREVVWIATTPAAPRLRRLEAPVPDDGTAVALAAAGRLTGLTGLAVELEPGPDVHTLTDEETTPEGDRSRLEALAGSPRLAGLTELEVGGCCRRLGCGRWSTTRPGPGCGRSP